MKTGLTLTELAQKLEAQRTAKKDLIVDTANLTMLVDDKKPVLELADGSEYPILPLAHQQIGGRTGIPSRYYDKMLTEAPDLLAHNVNTWFHRNPERRMLRTISSSARAFLSDRYQRIDNIEVAEAALTVLHDLNGVQIVSCEVTDHRLYIHFTVSTIQGEVRKGDVVQAGGIISNSEVGLGSASVAGMIWRLVCLNGMKIGDVYRKTHVGRKIDDNEELWADDTRRTDDRLVLMRIRDTVRALVDETRFRATLGQLQGLTEAQTRGDPAKAVEVLAQKIGVSDVERGGILRSLIEGADLSAWGLVNAVTAQAHTATEYDRAVEIESLGGRLVALPKSEWREILEAA